VKNTDNKSKAVPPKKQSEANLLLQSAKNWQATFDGINDSIFLLDPEGIILQSNKSSEKIFGDKNILGCHCFQVVLHKDCFIDNCPLLRSKISKKRETTLLPIQDKWFYVTVDPILDKSNTIKSFVHIVSDVTLQKQSEESLRQSEDNYRDLVENSSDLLCTHDLDGNLLSINNAAVNVTGYSKEEALKMNMRDILVPEYQKVFSAYLIRIKEIGHAKGLIVIKTKSGEKRIWEFNNTLRTAGVAKPIVRGMVKDVTELKNTEAVLKKLNTELAKSNAEKDKFFSIIAHDLKSPFFGFLGLTQDIAKNADDISAHDLAQFGRTMYQSADNLFKLLQNLLEWAQLQSGHINLDMKNISLTDIVNDNINTMQNRSDQKGISIINLVTKPVNAYADKKMINSVLLNLLSNAVKFTKQNGTITINALPIENEMIQISIQDTGVGIPNYIIEKLFHVGEETGRKGTGGELSTGIGLLLSKEFIDKNGGKIWVESEEGVGTTFYFTLRTHT
jgi:PAS domain S-box-containing protein